MSPALQAQIDLLAASDAENPLCLERALGGAAGVQLATLSEALASVDLDLVATLPPALQDILNTALNSTSTNLLCLERELGGAAGVQLAILAAIMASGGGGGGGGGPSVTYVRTTLANGAANTIDSPGGSPANGDVRIYLFKQPASGAAATITFNAIFVFPDGFIPSVSTTNGKTDLMEATFLTSNSVGDKWVVTKFIGGYSL